MSRAISAGLNAHLQLAVTTRAQCAKIRRADGEIFAFTTFDSELAFDAGDGDGSIVYSPSPAMNISALRRQSGLAPDNAQLEGAFDDDRISKEDLRAGRYDGAECITFELNWADLSQGRLYLGRFKLGKVELKDTTFSVELLSLAYAYSATVGRLTEVACNADLGDARCKVRVDPPAWAAATAYTVRPARDAALGSVVKPSVQNGRQFRCTVAGTSDALEPAWDTTLDALTIDGAVTWRAEKALKQVGTVTGVTDLSNFAASGVSLGADHWTLGALAWLTGNNAGLKDEVKDDNGTGTLKLYRPQAFAIVIGDTFEVTAGCDKSGQGTHGCRLKFDNIWNDRGLRFVPGADVATNYGNAEGQS
jgi:uncharacterized phage protein (TIGR02218 family)